MGGEGTFLQEKGGWETSMEPHRFPAPKLASAQNFLADTLPRVPGIYKQDARVWLPVSLLLGLSEGRTHPPRCFFFINKITTPTFSHFASPAKTFSGLRPLHVDLPSLSQQPLRETHPPQHVTDQTLFCFLPKTPFSLALTNK